MKNQKQNTQPKKTNKITAWLMRPVSLKLKTRAICVTLTTLVVVSTLFAFLTHWLCAFIPLILTAFVIYVCKLPIDTKSLEKTALRGLNNDKNK